MKYIENAAMWLAFGVAITVAIWVTGKWTMMFFFLLAAVISIRNGMRRR